MQDFKTRSGVLKCSGHNRWVVVKWMIFGWRSSEGEEEEEEVEDQCLLLQCLTCSSSSSSSNVVAWEQTGQHKHGVVVEAWTPRLPPHNLGNEMPCLGHKWVDQ